MAILEERSWAGSETSLRAAVEAEAGITTKLAAGPYDQEEQEAAPRLLSVEDGIATISIKGSLVNSDSPYLQYFGATGYPEIREAMLAAANDPDVKQILLDVDSGGGAVSGCDDTGKLIRLVNDQVKPVTTYTDGNMCSAAYWLGCSAGKVYSGKASLVGSIGIISTFREYSEANKMEGVGVTVLRAGKYKALANNNEKLTPEARAQIQKLLDSAYGVFVEHVSAMRGKGYEYADKTMADGQEFIGQAAVDVGLTDGITTFDSLITDLKQKIVASASKSMDNTHNDRFRLSGSTSTALSGESSMAKKALTEADIAALAAGATLPDITAEVQPDAEALAAAALQEAAAAHQAEEALASADTALSDKSAVKDEVDNMSAAVQLLSSQLKDKDAALLDAGIKMAGLQAFKDEYEAVLQPLKDIVGRSAHIMHISQGGTTRDFAAMQPADLIAEHARLSVGFIKFPVGGVAAVVSDPAEEKSSPYVVTNVTQAQINAVRGIK